MVTICDTLLVPRDNRIRISDEEKELLDRAMEVWYGEDVAEEVSYGKAIGRFSHFIIDDQGPPPEGVRKVGDGE